MLCDACAALRLGDLRAPAGYQLHANAKDIVASARTCELCALIQAALLQDLTAHDAGLKLKDALPAEPVTLYGGFLQDEEADEAEGAAALVGDTEDEPSSSSSSSSPPSPPTSWARLTGIEVHVGRDDNLNIVSLNLFTVPKPGRPVDEADEDDDISGRPLLEDAGSEAALALLRAWLGACVRDHPQCRGTLAGGLEARGDDGDDDYDAPPRLPTRVIDVGAAVPRLVISNGARAKYAALSHCWGQERFLTTTTGNLAAHCVSIPPLALTKTFRDAVAVTRALDLRYLWIDSLCIVQDSSADWRTESAQMGHVYQRAELTIAATGASDGRGGCFLPRPTRHHTVRLDHLRGGDRAARPVFAGLYPDQSACSLSKSPLGERAWITQEWLFSRRTVHYTQARMVWSCKARLESEDGEGVARMDEQRLHHSLERYRRWKADTSPARDPLEPVGFYSDWCDLITTYTARALTYETDKPVAILSLALDVQQRLGERWQHGLFHGPYPAPNQAATQSEGDDPVPGDAGLRYLALQLLWFGKRVLDRPAALAHQPSWSWLSTMGPVNVHAPARVAGHVVSSIRIVEGTATDGNDHAPKRPMLAITGPLQSATALDQAIRAAHPAGAAASPPPPRHLLAAHRRADEGARFFSRSSFLRTGAAIMPLGTCHFFGADPDPAGPPGAAALRVRTGWGSFDNGALPPLAGLFVAALSRNRLDDDDDNGRFDGYNVLYLAERPDAAPDGTRAFVRVGMGEILHEEAFPPACYQSYCVF